MLFLNYWMFFALIPLYFIYQKHHKSSHAKESKLLYITLVLLFIAASRPVIQNTFVNQKFHSQDFIIALDASYSMQANDLKPSRYAMAKEAIKKLMNLHKKDRFTLFLFTSNTLLISPPTTDTTISLSALDAINPDYILTKSTSLKNLFSTIATLPLKEKKLIIFSDGGDEHNLDNLSKIALKNAIVPYVVATASKEGAALKKDNHYLKNLDSSLVISKINPFLEYLAQANKGKYYVLNSLDIIDTLSEELTQTSLKEENIKVQSYKELFSIPLALALVLFFLSVSKFGKFLMLLPLFFFLPQKVNASLLDFYHISKAEALYQGKEYKDAANEYKKIAPSVSSYYNIGVAYYKSKNYKAALFYFTKIQTHNRVMKQKLLYNIANCAFRLKQYDKAKTFYLQTLVFSPDTDALYNLRLIQKFQLKAAKNVKALLTQKEPASQKKQRVQKEKEEEGTASNSKSNKQSQESTNGAGGDKKKKVETANKKKSKSNNYKVSYRAYEKINKGYSHEKEPW